jgi:CheY-like chemotaxis protein
VNVFWEPEREGVLRVRIRSDLDPRDAAGFGYRDVPSLVIAPVASPTPPRTDVPGRAHRHIVIADFDPFVAELLKHRMKNEGWRVTVTGDGEEAERLIQLGDVDAILLDLALPHRSGFDILHALYQRTPRLTTKLVVLSSINREETVQAAFSLDADDFIPKPFNPAMVVSRVRRLLRKGPADGPFDPTTRG